MKSIKFSLENIRAIEKFTGTTLESYFQIGDPCGTFLFPQTDGQPTKTLKLKQGDEVFKDEQGALYLKISQ